MTGHTPWSMTDPATGEPLSEAVCHIISETAAERDKLRKINNDLLEALRKISKGEGAFSLDPLQHAKNCLHEMRYIADAAIAKAGETA